MRISHVALIATLVTIVTAVITWFASLYVFERPIFDDGVEQGTIQSAMLGESRTYLVHLPSSYRRYPHRHYPVIYVLDGSSQDVHTAASAALMASIDAMPEVILVGIPNVSGAGRQRDYTPPGMRQDSDEADSPEGRADRFLAFLQRELIPRIERDYRTTSRRLLAGNSRGGLFVLYAATARTAVFDTYIANSPALWRDGDEIVERLDRFLHDAPPPAALFLSLGSDENPKMRRAFEHAVRVLDASAPTTLRWHAQLTPGAQHGNNAERATPVALRWTFDPAWQPPGTGSGSPPASEKPGKK